MEPTIIAACIALVMGGLVYGVYSAVFSSGKYAKSAYTRNALDQIYTEAQEAGNLRSEMEEAMQVLKVDIDKSPTLKILSFLPGGKKLVVNIVKAGMRDSAGIFCIFIMLLILIGLYVVVKYELNPLFSIVSIVAPLFLGRKIIQGRIDKRNREFIELFPDALDMIVRSVRSGFPLNSAINMVCENIDDPIKTEFQQLSDEIALGRPLGDALERLAVRIPEPDIRFFVVVLKIQQETGGNLGEVIGNLSGIIRKRKQLRRKIRAMTSEGRATSYILSAIPVGFFGMIMYMSPDHVTPLFESDNGNIVLATSIGLVILAQIVVRKMIDIDI
jgi:tight adherence protein B